MSKSQSSEQNKHSLLLCSFGSSQKINVITIGKFTHTVERGAVIVCMYVYFDVIWRHIYAMCCLCNT